jgi:hypothetical protein
LCGRARFDCVAHTCGLGAAASGSAMIQTDLAEGLEHRSSIARRFKERRRLPLPLRRNWRRIGPPSSWRRHR